jgi:hypothetical protein
MNKQELDLYLDPILQAHFETVKGEWLPGDMFYASLFPPVENDLHYVTHLKNMIIYSNAKWLPKSIDTENPSRGLWGMVDWKRTSIHRDRDNVGVGWTILTWCTSSDVVFNNADTPTAALLMALREQVGGNP